MEKDLKHTKRTLGEAVVTLVKGVKKLENQLKTQKRKGVVVELDEEVTKGSDKLDLEGLHLLATTTVESAQDDVPVVKDVPAAPPTETSSPKDKKVLYVRRKYLAEHHKKTDASQFVDVDMTDVSTKKILANASQSGDTFFVAGKEYVSSPSKKTSANPMPKVVSTDE